MLLKIFFVTMLNKMNLKNYLFIIVKMNFFTELLIPQSAGFIYGTSIAIAQKNLVNNIKKSPFFTTVNILTTGVVTSLVCKAVSKYFVNSKDNVTLSSALLGLSIYNVYRIIKINKKDKKDENMRSKILCECNTDCVFDNDTENILKDETENILKDETENILTDEIKDETDIDTDKVD
jgi:hypothetical protein